MKKIILISSLCLVILTIVSIFLWQNNYPKGEWYTSSYHTAKYYYHDSCQGWQNLSSKRLKAFNSEEELLNEYNRALHPDCEEYMNNKIIAKTESNPYYEFCLSESIKVTNEKLEAYEYSEQEDGSWIDKDGNYLSPEDDNEINELLNETFFNCIEEQKNNK